jgi:hypothetical protein
MAGQEGRDGPIGHGTPHQVTLHLITSLLEQAAGHLHQQGIAGGVNEGIVDGLEAIHIALGSVEMLRRRVQEPQLGSNHYRSEARALQIRIH